MEFISEKSIEKVLDQLENEAYFNKISTALIEEQPEVVGYFESESFDILSDTEKDVFWYCLLVLYASVKSVTGKVQTISMNNIATCEEINYELIGDQMKYKDMADLFFENQKQEDLLAFVEDTLIPDEDDILSPVGRKVIFISLKTFIDALDKHD